MHWQSKTNSESFGTQWYRSSELCTKSVHDMFKAFGKAIAE